MSAFLFIQQRRKSAEKIYFVEQVRLATNGSKDGLEKSMMKWARDAEIDIRFED